MRFKMNTKATRNREARLQRRRAAAWVLALAGAAGVMGSTTGADADAAPASSLTETGESRAKTSWDKVLENEVVQAFTKGKASFNARLRWEHADAEGLKPSDAVTIRPRLGFTTAPVYGLQGMLEAENVTSLGAPYNPAGLDPDELGRTVIPDPETTEINQAWLGYTRWDTTLAGGRQHYILDDQRFVGDVDWRQNQQTFDGLTMQSRALENATFFYGYVSRVNRVLGDGHADGNWRSDSHLVNASYSLSDAVTVTGYGYFLAFDNSPANSSSTLGGSVTGKVPVGEEWKLDYRGELAWQTDARDNPNDYSAMYVGADLGASYQGWNAGAGYELLGSDNGASFRTPLALLHKYNGWADSFLTTPANGLQDLYVRVGTTLPYSIPLQVQLHKFWSHEDALDYGYEIDAVVSRKFGKYFAGLMKYAYHDADSGIPDIHRFWLQGEFNY
ncbi:MAG: alginate export family protein [Limisphaerales bacterium]